VGFGQDDAHFFIGHAVFRFGGLAQQRQHQFSGAVQQPDKRGRDTRQQGHRRGNAGSDAFGVLQCDLLGHQFAHDQGQIGQQNHHRAHAQRVGPAVVQSLGRQPAGQTRAQGGAGKRARQHAYQGNADLDRRQKAPRILRQTQGGGGPLAAAVRHHLQPGRAGRDDRKFRHGQRPVEEDQGSDDQDFGYHGGLLGRGCELRM